jgi:hypothetical protein
MKRTDNLNINWVEDGTNFLSAMVKCPAMVEDYLRMELNKVTGWVRIEYHESPAIEGYELEHSRSPRFDHPSQIRNQGDDPAVIDWTDWQHRWEAEAWALYRLTALLWTK